MTPLHLLCAPFPSPQGTQAAVASMLAAEARDPSMRGASPRLLAYAESYGPVAEGVAIERLPRVPLRVGPRSGPSFARIAHDLGALGHLARRVDESLVLAHHVEAGTACALSGTPYLYVAHASMRDELPSYGGPRGPRAALGAALDRLAAARARAIAAVSPALAETLAARFARPVHHLPVPWTVPSPIDADERARARVGLGLDGTTLAVLHAGNLDGYQGLEALLACCAALAARRPVCLVVATASEATDLAAKARARNVPLVTLPLHTEADRRRAHAVADVAVFARSVPYGLPIKLLEALARGVPVVCTERSAAGLPLAACAELVSDADATAARLADATERAIVDDVRARRVAEGRAYVASAHGDEAHRDARARILASIRPIHAR